METMITKMSREWTMNKFNDTTKGISYKYQNKRHYGRIDNQIKQDYLGFEKTNYESACRNHLTLIENQFIYVNKSETNGRLNHSLTQLNKQLLGCLTLECEDLLEIDLMCAQPLLLANLLDNIINNTSKLTDNYLSTFYTTHYIPLLCSDKESGISDIDLFIALARMGKLYEYYALKQDGECQPSQRADAKLDFISVMYSKFDSNSKSKKRFCGIFPNLCHLLDQFKKFMIGCFEKHLEGRQYPDLKKFTSSKNKGKKDAKSAGNDYLAVRLQIIESEIFIERIWKSLRAKTFEVIPRHDSFLCRESQVDAAAAVVREELNDIFGKDNYRVRQMVLNNNTLQPLPLSFIKRGYRYQQLLRTPTSAIYEQRDPDSGKFWYEVIVVRIKKAGEFKGKHYPRREKYPSDNDWGERAWTIRQLSQARMIMYEIELFGRRLGQTKTPSIWNYIIDNLMIEHLEPRTDDVMSKSYLSGLNAGK